MEIYKVVRKSSKKVQSRIKKVIHSKKRFESVDKLGSIIYELEQMWLDQDITGHDNYILLWNSLEQILVLFLKYPTLDLTDLA